MDTTLNVGLSRQMVLHRALEVAANNIANADTAGFKVEQLIMEEDPLTPPAPGSAPVSYVYDQGVARDFGQGVIDATGNPFDMAIEGDGFFTIQRGATQYYTRDGRFSTNSQNQLVNKQGDPVLDTGGSPIVFDPNGPSPDVSRDGTVSQGTNVIGRIGVARFATLAALKKEGDNLYSAPVGVAPIQAPDAVVRQQFLEKSNVQPVLEITHLIEVTRAYEQVAKMMDQTQTLASTAIQRLGQVS